VRHSTQRNLEFLEMIQPLHHATTGRISYIIDSDDQAARANHARPGRSYPMRRDVMRRDGCAANSNNEVNNLLRSGTAHRHHRGKFSL
jgi:hypothetical protein